MTGQTTAFDSLPAVDQPAILWVCARCGTDDPRLVWADPSRPSLDPRYALGFCDVCAPARKSVKGVTRKAVALVRSEMFDRAAFLARAETLEEQALLTKFRQGHVLKADEIDRVRSIIDRLDQG
jgi:hypothetical protein